MTEGTWLVIGVQASGKSTVADLLAHQLERGGYSGSGTGRSPGKTGLTGRSLIQLRDCIDKVSMPKAKSALT